MSEQTIGMPAIPAESHSVEEKLNSVTHAIGAGMSIAGLAFLLAMSAKGGGGAVEAVSFAVYGACQIVLYMSSALTHLFIDRPRAHARLRALDQAAVYLLIAGTYTPVALVALEGPWSWAIFGIVWGLALAGVLLKTVILPGKHIATDLLYIPMGWLIVVAIKPLRLMAPEGFVAWTMVGGGLYTGGIVFYLLKKVPFAHVVWHLFVLAGSICFFMGFAIHLT